MQESIAIGFRQNDIDIPKIEHIGSDTRAIIDQNGKSIQNPELKRLEEYVSSDLHGQDIADLAKKTKTTLLASIGFPEFERGALAYGSTNEWRMEQAIKYNR
jgi:hypothetical protein